MVHFRCGGGSSSSPQAHTAAINATTTTAATTSTRRTAPGGRPAHTAAAVYAALAWTRTITLQICCCCPIPLRASRRLATPRDASPAAHASRKGAEAWRGRSVARMCETSDTDRGPRCCSMKRSARRGVARRGAAWPGRLHLSPLFSTTSLAPGAALLRPAVPAQPSALLTRLLLYLCEGALQAPRAKGYHIDYRPFFSA